VVEAAVVTMTVGGGDLVVLAAAVQAAVGPVGTFSGNSQYR
jgi:hypothetical protein